MPQSRLSSFSAISVSWDIFTNSLLSDAALKPVSSPRGRAVLKHLHLGLAWLNMVRNHTVSTLPIYQAFEPDENHVIVAVHFRNSFFGIPNKLSVFVKVSTMPGWQTACLMFNGRSAWSGFAVPGSSHSCNNVSFHCRLVE